MADDAVAFPTLTDADMAVMAKIGTRRPMAFVVSSVVATVALMTFLRRRKARS